MINDTVMKAARNLYDNRLGHQPGNPCWHAPKYFWEQLGEALDTETTKETMTMEVVQPSG